MIEFIITRLLAVLVGGAIGISLGFALFGFIVAALIASPVALTLKAWGIVQAKRMAS